MLKTVIGAICIAVVASIASAETQELALSPQQQADVEALAKDEGRLYKEIWSFGEKFSLQKAYYLGVAAVKLCASPPPSKALHAVAAIDNFAATADGKKLAVIMSTLVKLRSASVKDRAEVCALNSVLLDAAEAKPKNRLAEKP